MKHFTEIELIKSDEVFENGTSFLHNDLGSTIKILDDSIRIFAIKK